MAFSLPADMLETCDGIFYCLAQWANSVTGGFFWVAILIAFIIVLFMATMRFGTPRAFGFSTLAGLLGAIWLVIMNLIPWTIASQFIIAGIIGVVVLIVSGRD